MFVLSSPHLIIVLVIFLLIFGPNGLGDLDSSLGKGISGFKKAMNEPNEIGVTSSDKEEVGRVPGSGLEAQNKLVQNNW
jgi:TatA/E family protein of Tat protein translocase